MGETRATRPRILLAFGAALGLLLAALDLVGARRDAAQIPDGAVAVVDGVPILRADYDRALTALAADRRTPLGAADRRRVLDRLVDEELLVQRGLELGLARRDRRVRSDIVASVVESVVSEAATREPTAAEVEAFFAEHRDLFQRAGRVRVRQVLVRVSSAVDDDAAHARANEATQRLRGGADFATVARELGDAPIAELPSGKIDPATVREYLGPTVATTVLDLPVGAASDPIRSAAGYHVVEVVEREPTSTPELATIDDEVRGELRRQNQDEALRAYVDELRAARAVRVLVREPPS